MYYTILYYTMLCYTLLYYNILYYIILYYTILYHVNMCYSVVLQKEAEGGGGRPRDATHDARRGTSSLSLSLSLSPWVDRTTPDM